MFKCLINQKQKPCAIRYYDDSSPNIILQMTYRDYEGTIKRIVEKGENADNFPKYTEMPTQSVIAEVDYPPYFITQDDENYNGPSYSIKCANPFCSEVSNSTIYLYSPNEEDYERIKVIEENLYYMTYELYGPAVAMESCNMTPLFIDGVFMYSVDIYSSLTEEKMAEIVDEINKNIPDDVFLVNRVSHSVKAALSKLRLTIKNPVLDSKMRISRQEAFAKLSHILNVGARVYSSNALINYKRDNTSSSVSIPKRLRMMVFTNGSHFASCESFIAGNIAGGFPFYTRSYEMLVDSLDEILDNGYYEQICEVNNPEYKIFRGNIYNRIEICFPLTSWFKNLSDKSKTLTIESQKETLYDTISNGNESSGIKIFNSDIFTKDDNLIIVLFTG